MRDDQLAVIEDVVADQSIEECGHVPLGTRGDSAVELRQRLREAVRDLHIPPAQFPHQFHVVIAGHAERIAARDHPHHQPQHGGNLRPAIDEIADEDRLPAVGWNDGDRLGVVRNGVTEIRRASARSSS